MNSTLAYSANAAQEQREKWYRNFEQRYKWKLRARV